MPAKGIADVLNYGAICLAGYFDDKPQTIITFGTFGLTIDHVRGFIAGGCSDRFRLGGTQAPWADFWGAHPISGSGPPVPSLITSSLALRALSYPIPEVAANICIIGNFPLPHKNKSI